MTTAPGPLAGVKVIELAGIGPGPLAATLLADLGAHVLRIDRPGAGGKSFDLLDGGRAWLEVDLRTPEGAARIRELATQADVLIEGNRPGVTERLGIGPDDLLALNPRLVYGRMTGWGQDGPRAKQAGHDINYLSLTGMLHAIGEPGRRPVPPLNLAADFGGGTMFLVVGVLSALLSARETGKGQVVDAAMVDGASFLSLMIYRYLNAGIWKDDRGSNLLDGGAHFYGTYETADGKWMACGPIEPQFYAQFLEGLGLDPAGLPDQNDQSAWVALRGTVAQRFAEHDQEHWVKVFDPTDACVSPVLSMTDAPQDAHLAARGTFVDGERGKEPGPAPRFSGTPTVRGGGAEATRAAFGLSGLS